MTTMTFLPARTTDLPLFPRQLELAPAGWRACVDKLAEGLVVMDEGEAVCVACGGVIERGAGRHTVGHTIDCLTMHALRLQAEEPILRARFASSHPQWSEVVRPLPVLDVDIDAAHARQAAARTPAVATEGGAMQTHEAKLLQAPAALPAPANRLSVPWLAFAALLAVVYSGPFLFYQADADFLDAVAGILCAIWCVMRLGWLGWRTRLLAAAGLVALPLGVAYLVLGLPPLGVWQVLYSLLTSRPPFVMMMGVCL